MSDIHAALVLKTNVWMVFETTSIIFRYNKELQSLPITPIQIVPILVTSSNTITLDKIKKQKEV